MAHHIQATMPDVYMAHHIPATIHDVYIAHHIQIWLTIYQLRYMKYI